VSNDENGKSSLVLLSEKHHRIIARSNSSFVILRSGNARSIADSSIKIWTTTEAPIMAADSTRNVSADLPTNFMCA